MSAAATRVRDRLTLVSALPWVLLALLATLDVALQPALLSREQLGLEIATAMSLILVALGQTVVIITRGIDLSVGGMMGISNCLLATHAGASTGSLLLWVAIVLAVGVLGGALNGALVGLTRLQPFVVTLATWSIFNGIALWILPSPGGSIPEQLISLPLGEWLGLPRMLWLLAAVCAAWALLRRSRTGARVYALGSDPDAAYLSGVPVVGVTIRVYAFSGFCAALAGVFVATQTASGSPTVGTPFILSAVAAVVIGGTSLFGGRGGFAGTVAGAFVLTIIAEVTFGLGINSNWGVLAQGLLLILAVAVNSGSELLRQRREERR